MDEGIDLFGTEVEATTAGEWLACFGVVIGLCLWIGVLGWVFLNIMRWIV